MELLRKRKIKVEFLPPYSPDFNPIEYSFSVIKAAMRKERTIKSDEPMDDFAEKVLKIAGTKITAELAKSQFRHCNYNVC